MAFGGRELRLFLSVQSYGASNLARLRRDIAQLSSATEAANKRQAMLQDRLTGQQLRAARIAQRIDRMTLGTGRVQGLIQEARLSEQGIRIFERRGALARKENELLTSLAAKRAQIAATEARIADPTRALRTAIAQSRLQGKALDVARARAALPERELAIQSSLNRNLATQIGLQRTLSRVGVTQAQVATGLQGQFTGLSKNQEMWTRRMVATQQAATKLKSQLARMPAELARVNAQAATLTKQEQLQVGLVAKQADAVRALNEQLFVQQSQYANIQARLAAIAGEREALLAQEKTLTLEEQKRLVALEQQAAALQVQSGELARIQGQTAATQAELAAMPAIMRKAEIEDAAHAAEQAGRKVAHFGRTAQFAGLITTAAFGMAANTFADFSERTSLAGTQMRDIGASFTQTAQRTKELQDRILDLGMRFPASATEMSEAAYEIFSSMNIVRGGVVNTAKGFQLLEQANKAAVAGGVELEEATDAMIVVLNNFDPQLRNSSQLLNEMFSVVRFGNLRLNDLGAAMNYLAPIAKTVGLEFADVGAAFATLTILTKNTETASTGLARAIELFRLPVVQQGLEKWGVSITDVHHRLLPLNEIIGRLIKRFPGLATGQQSAIEALIQITKASEQTKVGIQGTVQARRAIASLATSMDLYNNILGNVTSNQDEFNRALQARMADPGVQWQIFLRQMQTLVLVIGREALPVFLALGNKIAEFIKWFKELNPVVRENIIRFAAVTGMIALFGGTILNVVGSISALRANMVLMSLATEGATKRLLAFRLVMGTIALVGIFALVEQMYDLKTAIVVTTTAWLVWKSKMLQSIASAVVTTVTGGRIMAASNATAAAQSQLAWTLANRAFLAGQATNVISARVAAQSITTANLVAASTVKTAWRAALVATGWGALAVAAGLAAEYVMTHWDQVRAFFQALAASIAVIWHNLWELVKAEAELASAKTQGFFEDLPPVLGVKFGIPFMDDPNEQIKDAQKKVDRLHAEIGGAFTQTYDKAMDAYEKARKAKNKKQRQGFLSEYQKLVKELVSSDLLKAQEDFVKQLNPETSGLSDALEDAAQIAKARTDAIAAAHENMEQKITSAVDKLMQTYEQFKQANEQAMGSIFQGPVMGGVLGDVFTQINDQMRQFGVQIPIPFEILRRDMDMQLTYFRRWRADLDKLAKRGAPLEFIQELQKMGPEKGIPIVEGLLSGSKGAFKDIVKDWENSQKLIHDATKKDMDAQLDDWMKHGKNIALQIILGIRSEQVALEDGFRRYVVGTFGRVLKAGMTKEVQAAVAQAMKDMAASNALNVATKAATAAAAGAGAGGPPPTRRKAAEATKAAVAPLREMTRPQTEAALRAIERKKQQIIKQMQARSPGRRPRPTQEESDRLVALEKQRQLFAQHMRNIPMLELNRTKRQLDAVQRRIIELRRQRIGHPEMFKQLTIQIERLEKRLAKLRRRLQELQQGREGRAPRRLDDENRENPPLLIAAQQAAGLKLPKLIGQLKGIDARQAAIFANIRSTRPGQGPSAKETAQLRALQKREDQLLQARNEYLARERRAVAQQLQTQRRPPGQENNYTITYQGDTVTVKADGATVASVMRALNKKKFQRQARMRTRRGQRR